MKRMTFLAMFLFAVVHVVAGPFPKLVLTSKSYAMYSDKEFYCVDGRINGFFTLEKWLKGKQSLVTVWINPQGVIESRSESTIDFAEKGGQTGLVWLEFGKEGGLLERDVSNSEYNGIWKVQVKIAETEIEQQFHVKC